MIKKLKYLSLFLILVISCLTGSHSLFAADDTAIRTGASELTTQAEVLQTPTPGTTVKKEPKPEITVEDQPTGPATEDTGPSFFVKKIELKGNTLFPREELAPFIDPLENKEVTFGKLKKVAQLITNYYRAKGYATSRAYIPPQKITDQTVMIYVLEGKVGNVFVEGNRFFRASVYRDSMKFDKKKILKYQDLENSLYFLNQKQDLSAKAYIISGEQPETSDIILKANESFPQHVSYEFNNRGTQFTHYARNIIHYDNNSLLGMGDVLNFGVSLAEEAAFKGLFYNYDFPIEKTNTDLQLNGSYSQSQLIGPLRPFDVDGESFYLVPSITQTFYESPKWVIQGYMGLEIKNQKTTILDKKVSLDKNRPLVVGPRISQQDRWGKTVFNADFHWGIPRFLGASKKHDPNASVPSSGGEFYYFTGSLARIQRLPYSAIAILRTQGQLSPMTLNALEQFRAGGAYSVRGYPESNSVGDYGFEFSTEIRVPPYFFPKTLKFPFTKRNWWDSFHFVWFLDGAKVFNFSRPTPAASLDRLLLGTGFGIRLDLGRICTVSFDLGVPFGQDPTDYDSAHVHMMVRTGF